MVDRGSSTRAVVALVVLLASLVGVQTVTTAAPADASTCTGALRGDWRNIDSSTRGMTRVVVETCQAVHSCNGNICSVHHGGTYLTPYGKCSPSDCNWGRRLGQHLSDGWVRTTHDFSFKTSYVWVKEYSFHGRTYLRVYVDNRFKPGDGRANYVTDDWFLRA
jgi:hypothetical protein